MVMLEPLLCRCSLPAPAPSLAPAPMAIDLVGKKKSRIIFMKVNMEGVPIGHKIDLKAYESYEKIYMALDEMFQGSIPAQKLGPNPMSENKESSVLSGRDFFVVCEDDEGDCMFVGDVFEYCEEAACDKEFRGSWASSK